MNFISISGEKTCHICGQEPAQYSNDSGILFCETCRSEAEGMKKGKFKPGQPVTFRLPADTLLKLRQLSAESGRSINYLATLAIKALIKKEKKNDN